LELEDNSKTELNVLDIGLDDELEDTLRVADITGIVGTGLDMVVVVILEDG
jgi:hypothetical protein